MDTTALLLDNWLGIAATAVHLGLTAVVVRRTHHSPLRFPLILLCVSMVVWSFAAAAHDIFGGFGWQWLKVTTGPLFVPFALHVVLAFVGRRRRHIVFLTVIYLFFFGLAVAGSYAFFSGAAVGSGDSKWYAGLYLAGVTVPLVYAIYRLTRHAHSATRADEVARSRLLMWGLVVGMLLGSTELFDNFYSQVVSIGHAGTLALTGSLTVVALRFRLLDYEVATVKWLFGTSVALVLVSGYLVFFGSSRLAFGLFVASALAFTAVIALRDVVVRALRERDRMERFATLGRFSAQMAHDLKNPLAALKGAVQFWEGELDDADSSADPAEVVGLVSDQIRRIEAIVERYQRMSSVEPKRSEFDLEDLLERQARSARHAGRSLVQTETCIDDDFPRCDGDEELLTLVFENLVRNAIEAMPDGGTLRIEADAEWKGLVVRIIDTGAGMDVRDLERAFDDFYTTKATGSGLGLAFARRVVDAHGGRIDISSKVDVGTTVTVQLPSS